MFECLIRSNLRYHLQSCLDLQTNSLFGSWLLQPKAAADTREGKKKLQLQPWTWAAVQPKHEMHLFAY
jgi:hypothetical protein